MPKEFRFDSKEMIVERQTDDAPSPPPLPANAHAGWWMARVMAAIGRFAGMPEEIERDRTPPRDAPAWE